MCWVNSDVKLCTVCSQVRAVGLGLTPSFGFSLTLSSLFLTLSKDPPVNKRMKDSITPKKEKKCLFFLLIWKIAFSGFNSAYGLPGSVSDSYLNIQIYTLIAVAYKPGVSTWCGCSEIHIHQIQRYKHINFLKDMDICCRMSKGFGVTKCREFTLVMY